MAIKIKQIDALVLLESLSDNSIDLIATDPPYFRVKKDAWDNQWASEADFLLWIEKIIKECARVLKPAGSFYMFASGQMANKIEVVAARHFWVRNHIVWFKIKGLHQKVCKAKQRAYFPATERIIFAVGDNKEKQQRDRAYGVACDPIIRYFRNSLKASGVTRSQVDKSLGNKMSGHWFGRSQWRLPNRRYYTQLQGLLKGYLKRDYDALIKHRDRLLKDSNDPSRRPFNVAGSDFNTDIWICPPVNYYDGKHPCEKPQKVMRHIVEASSNKGDLVLDLFVGGGSTALACAATGRDFIGSELDLDYVNSSRQRIDNYYAGIKG